MRSLTKATGISNLHKSTRVKLRCNSTYRAQVRRAQKKNGGLDYSASDLFKLFDESSGCAYCKQALDPGDFQFDHIQPVSRGGAWSLSNLHCVCASCNRVKHTLLHEEMEKLVEFLDTCSPEMTKSIRARLKLGARYYYN